MGRAVSPCRPPYLFWIFKFRQSEPLTACASCHYKHTIKMNPCMTEDASETGHGPLCPPILFLPSLPLQRRIMCWAQHLASCSRFFNLTYCYFSPPNIHIHTWLNFKGKMYVGKLSPSKECFLPAWRCSSIQQFTACNTDPVLRKWDPGLLQKHAHIHTYTHTCIIHMYIYKYMRAYTAMYIYTCI